MKLCSSMIILSIVCLFTVACSDENESTGVENNDFADQSGTVTVVDSTETATDTTDKLQQTRINLCQRAYSQSKPLMSMVSPAVTTFTFLRVLNPRFPFP